MLYDNPNGEGTHIVGEGTYIIYSCLLYNLL